MINKWRKHFSAFWRGAALLCFSILLLAASAQSAAANEQSAECRSVALPTWTSQELWVWDRLCQRQDADLSKEEAAFGTAPSVHESDGWPASRTLSSTFLQTILTVPKYTDLIMDRPIEISGARYPKDVAIDLRNSKISGSLLLMNSRFESPLFLSHATISGALVLTESSFGDVVDLENASIGANLTLARSRFSSEVKMRGAEPKGSVALNESDFGGVVDIAEAVLSTSLTANNATLQDLVLDSAQVVGNVDLTGAQIHRDVRMSRARVDGTLTLGGPRTQPARWIGENQALYLEGATAKGLDDAPDAWPPQIYMSDFMFDAGSNGFISRDSDWYINWLERDRRFCRMAYTQLENSLRAAGRTSEANAIGMARVARDYSESGNATAVLLDRVHYATVGYGYQPGRVIPWIVDLIALGAIAALYLPRTAMREAGASSLVILSAHRLIPLISFGEAYANIDVSSQKVHPWVRRYFYLHSILGYVLAAILVTAVAGITSVPTFK